MEAGFCVDVGMPAGFATDVGMQAGSGGQAKAARAAHPLHRCLNVISQLLEDPDVVELLDAVST